MERAEATAPTAPGRKQAALEGEEEGGDGEEEEEEEGR